MIGPSVFCATGALLRPKLQPNAFVSAPFEAARLKVALAASRSKETSQQAWVAPFEAGRPVITKFAAGAPGTVQKIVGDW